jgi:hypothetical protein
MLTEMDSGGYFTGRAMDRKMLPDLKQKKKEQQLAKRQKKLTAKAKAEAKRKLKVRLLEKPRRIDLEL